MDMYAVCYRYACYDDDAISSKKISFRSKLSPSSSHDLHRQLISFVSDVIPLINRLHHQIRSPRSFYRFLDPTQKSLSALDLPSHFCCSRLQQ